MGFLSFLLESEPVSNVVESVLMLNKVDIVLLYDHCSLDYKAFEILKTVTWVSAFRSGATTLLI